MNAVDNDLNIDSTSSTSSASSTSRPARRYWLGVGVAAVGIAVVTVGLALVPPSDEPSRVIVEPFPRTPGPSSVLSHETVTPPLTDSPPPPAPLPKELTEASRLQLDRIGHVEIGMTLDEASAAAGKPITIEARSDRGRGCAHAVAEGGPEGLAFMVINGRIARIEVRSGPVATLEGIKTGSTVEEVLAAYSGRIRVEPHTYTARFGGQYLIYEPDPSSGHLGLLFETDGSRVTMFRSGLVGAVMAPEGCS